MVDKVLKNVINADVISKCFKSYRWRDSCEKSVKEANSVILNPYERRILATKPSCLFSALLD